MEARNPLSVEDVFDDFNGRRAALIKALTDDQDKVFEKCDPEKENLCLYGYPNGSWEVNLPVEEVPPELPEPVLGINYSRDGLPNKDWRSLVAAHSDSWLLSVAFYFGARFGFGKNERMRLFEMINELPTIFEAVNAEDKPPKDQSVNQNSSKIKSSKKPRQCEQPTEKMPALAKEEKSEEEGEDEQSETLCGACGEKYATGEFWICCDACERWFHGKCVKITPAKAEHIKQYKCPSCSNNKRARVFSS